MVEKWILDVVRGKWVPTGWLLFYVESRKQKYCLRISELWQCVGFLLLCNKYNQKFSSLQQHTSIILKFLWAGNLGVIELCPLLKILQGWN